MSKVQDCKLTNVGELPFSYFWGGCNTFSFGIMLCFSEDSEQACHSLVQKKIHLKRLKNFFSFDGTNFKSEASSQFPHFYVLVLGSYRNSPFVTGQNSAINGIKTEILDYEAGEWKQSADYPFTNGNRYVNRAKKVRL